MAALERVSEQKVGSGGQLLVMAKSRSGSLWWGWRKCSQEKMGGDSGSADNVLNRSSAWKLKSPKLVREEGPRPGSGQLMHQGGQFCYPTCESMTHLVVPSRP